MVAKLLNIKNIGKEKKITIRKLRKCMVKDFSKKFRRTHCCRFTRICKGKKCREIGRHCFWTGRKIYKLTAFLRWKVICRDVPFGKHKNIRLNCCKIQQRCHSDGPVYKCENIKKSKCWWRGAVRGDVWIQDSNGQWVEVNAVGSFRYLTDRQNAIKVDTQFSQFGSGSITTGIVVRARKHVIKTEHGKVFLNGKKISKKGHNIRINFIGNHVKYHLSKKHKHYKTFIRGLTEQRFGFVYDIKTKSYELTVISESGSRGLFVDPLNPAKYQLTEKQSKFSSFVGFKMLQSTEGTPEQRRKAMDCCHILHSEEKLQECISDYVRTGHCLVSSFKKNQPDLILKNK